MGMRRPRVIYPMIESATNGIFGNFRKRTDVDYMIDSILNTSHFEKQNYHACGCILIYSNFRLLAQDTDPECRLLAQDTDPECLGFAIRFPVHPK